MIGKTLGHYEITSQLGKGGMGEVFHAKDQVLGREVITSLASICSYDHSSFRPNLLPSLKPASREFISIVSPHIMP